MLQIVLDCGEISKLHDFMVDEIRDKLPGRDRRILSIRFARSPREIVYSDDVYFTWNTIPASRGTERFRNVFGVFHRGEAMDALPVSLQINIPCAGTSPGVAGFFARDGAGTTWLMHSGRFGGSSPRLKKGVLFDRAIAADFDVLDINDGTTFRRAVRVAPVVEGQMVAPLFRFVRLVESSRRSGPDPIRQI